MHAEINFFVKQILKIINQSTSSVSIYMSFLSHPDSSGTYQPNVSDKTLILNIITSKPMVTTMSRAKENHPRTMAVLPTPLLTLPFPKSWAIIEAATEAVCCHKTETRTKIEAMKMMAKAIWETNRDGKGLTSRSLP